MARQATTTGIERLVATLLLVLLVLVAYSAAYVYYRQTHLEEITLNRPDNHSPNGLKEYKRIRFICICCPQDWEWASTPLQQRLPWYIFRPAIWLDHRLTGIETGRDWTAVTLLLGPNGL